jgi:cell division protein FtsN
MNIVLVLIFITFFIYIINFFYVSINKKNKILKKKSITHSIFPKKIEKRWQYIKKLENNDDNHIIF